MSQARCSPRRGTGSVPDGVYYVLFVWLFRFFRNFVVMTTKLLRLGIKNK